MKTWLFILAALAAPAVADAALRTETVEYRHGETVLEGYLAYDDAVAGLRPGVLVVHEWTGIGPYVRGRVEELARLGYIAFAPDIYGKGVRPAAPEAAAKESAKYKENRQLMRERAEAGFDQLRRHPLSDDARLAAVGYCFGGTVALELARSGADLLGTVSFHGGLATPRPEEAKKIRGKVLILHGADDPFVPKEEVLAFWQEMQQGKVDWQMNVYGNAVHSFTNPDSGRDPAKGIAYEPQADRRSWGAMKLFFEEVFGGPPRRGS